MLAAVVPSLFATSAVAQLAPAVSQSSAATAPTGTDSATASGSPAEAIVVTGSRLKSSNATSESPVVVVSAAQIAHSSSQTLEDVLQKLPELGTNGIYSTTNNGGGGVSCVELRNLGDERTLILVDGKRFVEGNASCVDLNNIPLDMVERIEILKDGASTTYGADAIAGVINIILKKNFTGVTFRANGSVATDVGDDKTGELSVIGGTNFDKGNFTFGAEYLNRGPVSQADRDWAQYPVQSDRPLGSKQTVGSIYNPNGQISTDPNNINPDTVDTYGGRTMINKDGSLGAPYTGALAQRFNFGALQQLSDSLEKEGFTTNTHYDFTENITGYLQTFYTHKSTQEQLAGQPVGGGLNPLVVPDAFVVPEGNPYLTNLLGAGSGPVDIYQRELQFGNRGYKQVDNTFQINGGFKGEFGAGWDYDVFFQYGEDDDQTTNTNNINFQHLEQEVGFQQTQPTAAQIAAIEAFTGATSIDTTTFGIYNPAVCVAASGCVLSNPFGQNFSQAAINYARYTEAQQNRETLKVYGGSISNSELYQLPAGPLGLSLGVEHRAETGSFTPDSLDLTGVTLGSVGEPTQGSFNSTEVYGETRIPILKDLPGAKDLHVDLGGRFFNYNNFGSGETWKVSGNYTPVDGIRIRGSDGVAFRQPSTNDLFTGAAISFNGATDPCAQVSSYGAKSAIVQKNCASQGVNTATFVQVGSQVQTIVGGNPNLVPETARTQTLGVVLTPPFIPRLAVTVDFYRTKIDNAIGSYTTGTFPTQTILDNCYTQATFTAGGNGNSNLCNFVNARAGTGQLNTVSDLAQNEGVIRTEALDIGTTYSYPINGYGVVAFENDATLTMKYQQQLQKDGPFIGYLGTIGVQASSLPAYPRLRDNVSLDWNVGKFSFGYRMRFIQGTVFDDYPGPYVQGTKDGQHASAAVPDVFYHDIVASYNYHNCTVNVGIDNLFDKAPPYVFDTGTNTDAAVYDIFGRVVYLKVSAHF
jgi:outer membrane cobalamin receptor